MFGVFSDIGQGWLYYALTAVYAFTVVGIIIVVISENRSPVKSLAWVTVLLLMPLLGVVLYIFFGRSIKNMRMISRRNRRRLRKKDEGARLRRASLLPVLSTRSLQMVQLTRTMTGSNPYAAEDVKIFTSGAEKFDALISDILKAKRYINVQYYIIEDDNTGLRLKDALMQKAREGVAVRVIYDNVGSFKTSRSFFRDLKDAGVEVYPFFKVVFPPFGTRINWRNHRKICVIDGEVGYIGGMNIADRYVDGGRKFKSWRDTHLRISGPAVTALQYSFAVDWNFMGQPLIDDDPPAQTPSPSDTVVQMVTSGPTSQWTNVAMLFLSAIASAKKRVFIQTPYFLPTEGLQKALQTAALSGVDVRIMIPLKSDTPMLSLASASYVEECLRAGIKIYMYHVGMLHAKTMVVDDEMVSVGSTNFDFRSFEHNFEANVQIFSKSVNKQLADIFIEDIRNCYRISQNEWRNRPRLKKIAESVVRLLSPIL